MVEICPERESFVIAKVRLMLFVEVRDGVKKGKE